VQHVGLTEGNNQLESMQRTRERATVSLIDQYTALARGLRRERKLTGSTACSGRERSAVSLINQQYMHSVRTEEESSPAQHSTGAAAAQQRSNTPPTAPAQMARSTQAATAAAQQRRGAPKARGRDAPRGRGVTRGSEEKGASPPR